jgi:flagellar motility protein MotE (MotC chaperone)
MADKKKKEQEPERPAYTLPDDPKEAMKQLKADRKQLRSDQKAAAKEARLRAKEMEEAEAELNGDIHGGLGSFLLILLIILVWLLLMAIMIKFNILGLGDTLTPALKDIPYIKNLLPGAQIVQMNNSGEDSSQVAADNSDYVASLEQELSRQLALNASYAATIDKLNAEVARLEPFEEEQAEFDKQRQQFYQDIVYNDNAPDASAYASYYAMIAPEEAAEIYEQIASDEISDEEVKVYAATFTAMKPKEAAAIFNNMSNITLVARILQQMGSDDRAKIMGKLDTEVAEKVTELLEPEGLPELSNGKSASGS